MSTKSGYGYISLTNNPDNSDNISSKTYGNIINLSSSKNTAQETIEIAGGRKYCLNLKFKRGSTTSDKFEEKLKIKNITLTKKQEGKLTLKSGIIEIDKAGNSDKYYSAIENKGIVNIEGGKITSEQKYAIGVKTLNGGTSNISGGEITLTSTSSGIAVEEAEKYSITNITDGNIKGYYGLRTEECSANANITGGNFDSQCRYQIYNNGKYSLIMLKDVNLTKEGNGSCVYIDATNSETIIDTCIINVQNNRCRLCCR